MLDNHPLKCNSFSFSALKTEGAFASVNNIFLVVVFCYQTKRSFGKS